MPAAHILLPYFFKLHFNITLISLSWSSKPSLTLWFFLLKSRDVFLISPTHLDLCMALQPFAGPWHLFQFLDPVHRTPWMGNQPITRPIPNAEHRYRINTHTFTPQVGFEPTIPAFEQVKTVHALDHQTLWSTPPWFNHRNISRIQPRSN
jgi:hypothetical protein